MMPEHDFNALFEQYPAVIAQMPTIFTSHEFILCLAQQNQALYIEALFSYRKATRRGTPAPFMIVHGILSKHLNAYPKLVTRIGDAPSKNIFGQPSECAQWRRL